MVNENLIPKTETVYELKDKYETPSFEEFMRNYEESNLNYDDLSSGSVGEVRGYGPCSWNNPNCTCYKSELQKQYVVAIRDNNSTVSTNIKNIWTDRWPGTKPEEVPLPSIRNVVFETTGSTKYDNYRVVGTVFGGLTGNLIGGAIEDTSMRIPKGILFTSERSSPLSWYSFYRTATMNRIPGTDRVDFHDYKIPCSSRDHLVELRDKIGNIVEICEFSTFSATNKPSKEQDFKNKVRDLLDKHSEGEDINGSYTIY